MTRSRVLPGRSGRDRDRLLTQGHQGRGGIGWAESGRMTKGGLFTHFAERFGIKRTEAGEFFDELQQLTEQELLRCGEFVLPGVAKLVVQQREKRMGRNPATGARVEIPAKQVVKARIAKQLKDVVEA